MSKNMNLINFLNQGALMPQMAQLAQYRLTSGRVTWVIDDEGNPCMLATTGCPEFTASLTLAEHDTPEGRRISASLKNSPFHPDMHEFDSCAFNDLTLELIQNWAITLVRFSGIQAPTENQSNLIH